MELFHEGARILSIILFCIAAFGAGVATLILVFKMVGQAMFGERFDDWWDSKFWF